MRSLSITLLLLLVVFRGIGQNQVPGLLKKLETTKDTNTMYILTDIANIYIGQGHYDSAEYYLDKALNECIKWGNDRKRSNVLVGLGYMRRNQGDYDNALKYLFEALSFKEKLKLYSQVADVKHVIGTVYLSNEDLDGAYKNLSEAEEIYIKEKDSARLLLLITDMGTYYATIKDHKKALNYFSRAIKICDEWEAAKNYKVPPDFLFNYKAGAIVNSAHSFIETEKPVEAINILTPLYDSVVKQKSAHQIIVLSYLANAYHKSGNNEKAIQIAEEGIQLIKSNENNSLFRELKDFYLIASDAYAKSGNYKNAYERYKLFKQVMDSISNESKIQAIAEMQTKYDTEKKDRAILQLNKEKKAQKTMIGLVIGAAVVALGLFVFALRSRSLQRKLFKQKEELLVKQKEIETNALQKRMNELEQMALRAQMNPHFIFNSLNSVQHYVMKQDIEGVNKYLSAFAHLVRQTLNNSGKQFVSLDEEVKYLDTYLSLEKMKSNNRFDYSIMVNEDVDRSATYIPGMILQPFVENSIKHGVINKENNDGQVNIIVSKNGKLVCLIEDNGIGRQKAGQIKLSAGDNEYQSKGMSITMNRIDTINKIYNTDISVQVDDVKDAEGKASGTRVKVQFPADLE